MTAASRVRVSIVVAALALSLPGAAHAEGGTIKGKVAATPPKYLPETVVYLKDVPGTYPPKTHVMDQTNMQFVPHVMTVTVGDTVKFENHDHLVHNVYSPDVDAYNLGSFKEGEERAHTFKKAGVYSQLCSVHPEMLGYIFAGQNPYSAVVDKSGAYEIKNVPPGTYKLAVWNSKLKAPDKTVTVAAGASVVENLSIKR